MPDMFLHPDDHYLLAKWEHLLSVFRITTRDYRRVLAGDAATDRHRTVIIQTVSDLLDVEVDLFRLGKDSPAGKLQGRSREVWQAAAAWVSQLREWRLPHDSKSVADIELALECRKLAEEGFIATVCDRPVEPADAPTLLVRTS